MDGDPTPALTGRRRTRPTSIGCRNPWQPEPGRAPLSSAKPAVQSNRATSLHGLTTDQLSSNQKGRTTMRSGDADQSILASWLSFLKLDGSLLRSYALREGCCQFLAAALLVTALGSAPRRSPGANNVESRSAHNSTWRDGQSRAAVAARFAAGAQTDPRRLRGVQPPTGGCCKRFPRRSGGCGGRGRL